MADMRELSPIEQANAQSAARTAIVKWKAQAKEVLSSRNHGLVLAGEDLGGIVLGAGADLLSRKAFQKWMKMKSGESAADFHNRFDYWTGGLSAGLGGASWVGSVALSHGEMSIHPVMQGLRTVGVTQLVLGLNRLLSNRMSIPA